MNKYNSLYNKILNFIIKKIFNILEIRNILLIISFFYTIYYFGNPATPGNSKNYPEGWWGWFDQGKYLLESNAFSQHDFSQNKFFYPPLYPFLGSFFVNWSRGHLFFYIDLVSLLWFSYVFIRFSDLYFPRFLTVILFFFTSIFNPVIFENFVIPWTSTLSTALISSGLICLVWIKEIEKGKLKRLSGIRIFFVATSLGLLVPTRPADAGVGFIICICLLYYFYKICILSNKENHYNKNILILSILGYLIGPLFFLIFNDLIFKSILGGYFKTVLSNGYFIADLPEKLVSIWLDGSNIYGVPVSGQADVSLIGHYPWLLLSIAGMVWILFFGDTVLRSCVIAILSLFIIYAPYTDLMPYGFWMFKNIHYFKWTFPFFALFAALPIKYILLSSYDVNKLRVTILILFLIPIILLTFQFKLTTKSAEFYTINNDGISTVVIDINNKMIDFIDIVGVSNGFWEVYFGNHHLYLDNIELKIVTNFRLIPLSSGVRVLFIRPVKGKFIRLIPDKRLSIDKERMNVRIGVYRFALGLPKFLRPIYQNSTSSGYNLGNKIYFSKIGDSQFYITRGWSGPEEWGRWSINNLAILKMHLKNVPKNSSSFLFEMKLMALVNNSYPCQKIKIIYNDNEIKKDILCINNGGGKFKILKFFIPKELVIKNKEAKIYIYTPNSISPKKLGINSDRRILGIGVRWLKISPA